MHFLFSFPETWQTRIFFSEPRSLYLDKKKKTWQLLITQLGKATKNCFETRRSMVETGVHLKLFMPICTRGNSSYPPQRISNEFHKTQRRNFFTAHIVTQMPEVIWFHYFIIVNYDFIMQTFLIRRRKIVKS